MISPYCVHFCASITHTGVYVYTVYVILQVLGSLNLHESVILVEPTHVLNMNQRIKLHVYFNPNLE